MAAQDFDASDQPTDVVASLSLTAGTQYAGQNLSTVATLFVREAPTVPAPGDRAYRVEAGGSFFIRPTGTPIYLWTDEAAGCPVIVGEAT